MSFSSITIHLCVLVELHMIEGLSLGPRFTVWGWAPTERHVRIMALDLIIERARGAGILDIARLHGIDHAHTAKSSVAVGYNFSLPCLRLAVILHHPSLACRLLAAHGV